MDKNKQKKVWDVIVIGGGPAGMMAAGRAAQHGKKVLLLEITLILHLEINLSIALSSEYPFS